MFAVMRVIAALPYDWQRVLGRMLGWLLKVIPSDRRNVARINIGLCFPLLTDVERQTLLDRHMVSLGQSLIETAMSWWTPNSVLQTRVNIEGLEHYQAARKHGKGVILLIGHFVYMELIGRLLGMSIPLNITYRQNKNALFDWMLNKVHRKHCASLITHNDLRGMFRVLKNNQALWYAPDQNYAGKQSRFVSFFGVQASTITATSKIAGHTGAKVVLVLPRRRADGQGYTIQLMPPLQDFPGESEQDDAQRILTLLEQHIRTVPEQYLWVHRRFKTRPQGLPSVYKK